MIDIQQTRVSLNIKSQRKENTLKIYLTSIQKQGQRFSSPQNSQRPRKKVMNKEFANLQQGTNYLI